jgi:trans-aconitate methyltransferase
MVDYDKFAETFSNSRINMKWEEIDYFVSFIKSLKINNLDNVLDIWCWNWRLIKSLKDSFEINNYVWVDLSENLLYEAKRNNPSFNFISWDMLEIDNLFFDSKIFNFTFLIASFHHLEKFEERILFLEKLKNVILKNSFIFMTNWALNSSINKTKYEKSIIKWSEINFDDVIII